MLISWGSHDPLLEDQRPSSWSKCNPTTEILTFKKGRRKITISWGSHDPLLEDHMTPSLIKDQRLSSSSKCDHTTLLLLRVSLSQLTDLSHLRKPYFIYLKIKTYFSTEIRMKCGGEENRCKSLPYLLFIGQFQASLHTTSNNWSHLKETPISGLI